MEAGCMERELELARKGLVESAGELVIKDAEGNTVWDLSRFRFLKEEECPDEINPLLWLNGRANLEAGLFEVVPGKIYQVRGFDLANLSLVRSRTGWIVFDCMTNVETASAALSFASRALGEEIAEKVRAVVVSHSHLDHYGGIRAVIGAENEGKNVPVYVPDHFSEETVREHVFAGAAMARRKVYQVGDHGNRSGAQDLVSTGIGLTQPRGQASFAEPDVVIRKDCGLEIDGLSVEFMLTPDTEAPAEMINYIPEYKAVWGAELLNATLHNLYPVRGAKVRDGLAWAGFLTEACRRWGNSAEVVFQSHNWPRWKTEEDPDAVRDYLLNTAAAYRFIHDRTLQMMNRGFTPEEIARRLKLPEELKRCGYLRSFYGTVPFNCRAVYQRYLGFFDANPVHLDPPEPVEAAKKYVRYMGGPDRILEKAEEDFQAGDYAWVAEVTNRVVFACPENERARLLCADALEQMAYGAESGIWRNAYLAGVRELRYGCLGDTRLKKGNNRILSELSAGFLLDYMAIMLDPEKTAGIRKEITLRIEDKEGESVYGLMLRAGALLIQKGDPAPEVLGPEVRLSKETLEALVYKRLDSKREETADRDYRILKEWEDLLAPASDIPFAIVEP